MRVPSAVWWPGVIEGGRKVETPVITSERRTVVPARVQLPKVYMAWLTPALYKPGDAEADITAQILGGGRSSRLYKKLVYELQIAQDVFAVQQSFGIRSVFGVMMDPISATFDWPREVFSLTTRVT